MNRTPVTSSAIVSVGHDPATNTLEIEFKGGRGYQYADVPVEKHLALMGAESIGKHFAGHIQGLHPTTKLQEVQP